MVSFLAGHGNHLSTPLKHVETPCPRSSCPITLIPSRAFNEALPRAELHPLDILSQYTSPSLLLEHTTHCHWPVPSLSSLTTTGHLGTGLLYKPHPFVLGSLIPDDGGSTHLWNVGRQSFYMAVYPRRQLWTSYSLPWELEISQVSILNYKDYGGHKILSGDQSQCEEWPNFINTWSLLSETLVFNLILKSLITWENFIAFICRESL
jgi:hypothetical protein